MELPREMAAGQRSRATSTTSIYRSTITMSRIIRSVAVGRNNRLVAGSLRAGQCVATVMSLVQSVKFNGHDP
jgi:hypothetical protein